MNMDYDNNNIFAKMLRGEIPCDKVLETEFALAFNDIAPQAPVHVLVIPKGKYQTMDDFARNANNDEKAGLTDTVAAVVEKLNLADSGYRLIVNNGKDASQEVPHLHYHILAGEIIGPLRSKLNN